MNTVEDKAWSPYIAGALSGVVFILSVWFAGKFVGASTTFVRSAGMIEKLFSAERVAKMDYFVKEAPKIEGPAGYVGGAFWPKPNQERHCRLHGWDHSHVRSPSGQWVTERPWTGRFAPVGGERIYCFNLFLYRWNDCCACPLRGR
jgi:hypothetical protein